MRDASLMNYSYLKSKRFLLPTLLWLAFVLIYLVLFEVGESKYYSLTRTLIQWDGQHYLSIARDGYQKFPCLWDQRHICGNIGWFPLYPLLGWLVNQLVGPLVGFMGVDIRETMLATGWLAFWLALLVMYPLVESRFGHRAALFSLLALLLFPSSFYFLTAFPYSTYLLLALLILYLIEKKRYTLVPLLSGLLAVTYPSGVVIGLPILYTLVTKWKELDRKKQLLLMAALFTIGFALFLFCCYYWWKFDDFFLYQRYQSQSFYGHKLTIPLVPIAESLINRSGDDPMFIILLFTLVTVILFYSRKIPASWQLFMFGILLFTPTFGTTWCYYRHIVVAFPLYVMIGVSVSSLRRKYLMIPYALASAFLMWKFFLAYYKAGTLM
jgi:hypothetical protein